MTDTQIYEWIVEILHKEVVYATGCTEPIALAYAAAVARKHLGCTPDKIEAFVSPNLMKNGMAVKVPGTGLPGMDVAAAVGVTGGDPNGGLDVLHHLSAEAVEKAKDLLAKKRVFVDIADTELPLYAEAKLSRGNHWSRVVIQGSHTNIIRIGTDEKIFLSKEDSGSVTKDPNEDFLHSLNLKILYNFATAVPLNRIEFMEEAGLVNDALSRAGLQKEYGLCLGKSMQDDLQNGLSIDNLHDRIVMETTAASDARMGGAPLPAMTNAGSGDQGITATVPVNVTARYVNASREKHIRALALSHITAIYIHSFYPKLSALCATATAAMGAAVGMTLLFDGGYTELEATIANMTAQHIGMICDGAGDGCSLKIATAVDAAYRAVFLSRKGIRVNGTEGLVSNTADESIRNIGTLATKGLKVADKEVLRIMISKNK